VLDHVRGPLPDRFEEFRPSVVAMDFETHLIASSEILFGSRTDGISGYLLLNGLSLEVRKRLARIEPELGVQGK
jgi:hypothetical protein